MLSFGSETPNVEALLHARKLELLQVQLEQVVTTLSRSFALLRVELCKRGAPAPTPVCSCSSGKPK